jgi:hypothetical protein
LAWQGNYRRAGDNSTLLRDDLMTLGMPRPQTVGPCQPAELPVRLGRAHVDIMDIHSLVTAEELLAMGERDYDFELAGGEAGPEGP